MLQTTLRDALINFSLLDGRASADLWSPRPLLSKPKPGAVRVPCSENALLELQRLYEGSHMQPLVETMRPIKPRSRRGVEQSRGVAVLVLSDYPNFFHQMGSVVATWASMAEAGLTNHDDTHIFLLGNASIVPTSLFWSPGLAASPPRFVRSLPPLRPAQYRHVVLAAPATEFWWWNGEPTQRHPMHRTASRCPFGMAVPDAAHPPGAVWKPDPTDRRALFRPFAARMHAALLQQGGMPAAAKAEAAAAVGGGGPLLLVQRPAGMDRRLLNERGLANALGEALGPRGPRVQLQNFGLLSTREQLSLVASATGLVGVHGAGLVWNLFLPEGAVLVELLNRMGTNEYYANHCRWTHRPYVVWQNNESSREEAALDGQGRAMDPFRNHLHADIPEVVRRVQAILGASNE